MFKKFSFFSAIILFAVMAIFTLAPQHAWAQGGGGTPTAPFAGNWSGTITTSFGTGAFTMRISQSQTVLSGRAHFGAPIFDATLKLAGTSLDGKHFTGTVSNGEGTLPITGTLSADGKTMTGTVIQGQTYTFIVTKN